MDITIKCGRLSEKAKANQSWPPIALTNNSVCNNKTWQRYSYTRLTC